MFYNRKTDPQWLEVHIPSDHPYSNLISKLREEGRMISLREINEDLWNAEMDLIASEDCLDDNDVREHLENLRDRLCIMRCDLTVLLGDDPDDLLAEYWGDKWPEPEGRTNPCTIGLP